MAFNLTGASTDRFEFGSPASLDNILQTGEATLIGWIRFTAGPAASWIMGKQDASGNGWFLFVPGADTTTLRLQVTGTTNLLISSATGWISATNWQFFAMTTNVGVADPEFYYGTLSAAAQQEATPLAQQQGITLTDDSGNDFIIGEQPLRAFWDAAGFDIGPFAFYDRALSLGEIISWQYHPQVLGANCVLFIRPGFHGAASCPDLSGNGNNATSFTGISLANPVPLGPSFGFDTYSSYTVVAAGVTVPVFIHHYQQAGGL